MDGPRYVSSLQSPDDPCCYKDFHECSVFEEAKQKADEAVSKNNRSALVYDRKLMAVTYKNAVETKQLEEKPVKEKKRGVRTKPKRGIAKEDYFD